MLVIKLVIVLLYASTHSISPVLGVTFCYYTSFSVVETVERQRNILNESIMNVAILREKRMLKNKWKKLKL